MNKTMCRTKRYMKKNFQLSKWSILVSKISKTFNKNFSSQMPCLQIITILRARKFYMQHFLGTPNTLPTASYSKSCWAKHYFSDRYCSFFRPMFENFALLRTRKQTSTCQDVSKRCFLAVYTRWLDSLMLSQNASFGQNKKLHEPISNTHSSFQSECVYKCTPHTITGSEM